MAAPPTPAKRPEPVAEHPERLRWLERRDKTQLPAEIVRELRALDKELADAEVEQRIASEDIEHFEARLQRLQLERERLERALAAAPDESARIRIGAELRGNAARRTTADRELASAREMAEKAKRDVEAARRTLVARERELLAGYDCVEGTCELVQDGDYHAWGDLPAALRQCEAECVGVERKRPRALDIPERQPGEWAMPLVGELPSVLPIVPTGPVSESQLAAALSALMREELRPSVGDYFRIEPDRARAYRAAFTSREALQELLRVEVVPLPPPLAPPEPAAPAPEDVYARLEDAILQWGDVEEWRGSELEKPLPSAEELVDKFAKRLLPAATVLTPAQRAEALETANAVLGPLEAQRKLYAQYREQVLRGLTEAEAMERGLQTFHEWLEEAEPVPEPAPVPAPAPAPRKRRAAPRLSRELQEQLKSMRAPERRQLEAFFERVDAMEDADLLEQSALTYGISRHLPAQEALKLKLAEFTLSGSIEDARRALVDVEENYAAEAMAEEPLPPTRAEPAEARLPEAPPDARLRLLVRVSDAPRDLVVRASPATRVGELLDELPAAKDARRVVVVDADERSFEVLPLAGSDFAAGDLPPSTSTLHEAIRSRLRRVQQPGAPERWNRAQRRRAWNLFNRPEPMD